MTLVECVSASTTGDIARSIQNRTLLFGVDGWKRIATAFGNQIVNGGRTTSTAPDS
jgi:hypothetical protein